MRVPKYRKHSTGKAFVEYEGRRHYFPGAYGSKESEAAFKRFLVSIAGEPTIPSVKAGSKLQVSTIALQFLLYAEREYVEDGKETPEFIHYRSAIRVLIEHHGNTIAEDFGPKALKEVRTGLCAERVRKVKVPGGNGAKVDKSFGRPSVTHVNDQVRRIRAIFRWAVSEEMVSATVPLALQSLKGLSHKKTPTVKPPRKVRPVSPEWVEATLPFLSPTVANMVRLHETCAMRSSELCRMRPVDIERFDDRPWEYVPTRHKGQAKDLDRIVFIGPRGQAILLPLLENALPEAFLFSAAESKEWHRERRRKPGRRVRPTKSYPRRAAGDRFTAGSYRRAVRYGIDAANVARTMVGEAPIPVWTPHRLRHTRGSAIRKKHGLEAAQVYLGHAKADVTQIYAERDFELARRVARESG